MGLADEDDRLSLLLSHLGGGYALIECGERDSQLQLTGSSAPCPDIIGWLRVFCSLHRPRMVLEDRVPGPTAKKLGSAGALKLAPPSASLQGLSPLVADNKPALVIHHVEVHDGCLTHDYPSMELLYYTDTYEYLLRPHFNSKSIYHPRTMRFLCMDARGAHQRLSVLWIARFLSAM